MHDYISYLQVICLSVFLLQSRYPSTKATSDLWMLNLNTHWFFIIKFRDHFYLFIYLFHFHETCGMYFHLNTDTMWLLAFVYIFKSEAFFCLQTQIAHGSKLQKVNYLTSQILWLPFLYLLLYKILSFQFSTINIHSIKIIFYSLSVIFLYKY